MYEKKCCPEAGDARVMCPDWVHEVVANSQRLINEIMVRRPGEPLSVADLASLPRGRSRIEELILHGLLLEIILRLKKDSGADITERAVAVIRDSAATKARQHQRHAAVRAARLIDARFAEPLNMPLLASELRSREATLRGAFVRQFGLSMRDYHKRARVRAATALFAAGHVDVLSVSRLVGYRSEKNFYAAVRQLTGGTAAELRATAIGGGAPSIVNGQR